MGSTDLHQEIHDLFDGRDFDGIVRRFADHFLYIDRARGVEIRSAQAFVDWIREWTAAIPNARIVNPRYLEAGNVSVALVTIHGHHRGQMGPLPPSGNEMVIPMCEVMIFDDDKHVTGGDLFYDLQMIMRQMTAGSGAAYRPAGAARAFWVLGGLYEVLLSAEESRGASTVVRITLPEGLGPPMHIHPGSETVYVLDGRVRYFIGDDAVDAGPGAMIHLPAGVVERFEATTRAELLVTYSPGGIEHFFAEVGEPAPRREVPPPPTTPPDVDRLADIGARYGMKILTG